jgi:transcriptional regulator with XRE-family HTH domain
MPRDNLRRFRLDQKMSQAAMADAIGYSRVMYQQVESGVRDGTLDFWGAVQKRFNIPDRDMWKLTKEEK